LRAFLMEMLVIIILQCNEDEALNHIEIVKQLSNFLSTLRKELYNRSRAVEVSKSGVLFLCKALEGSKIADLSPFTGLTAERVFKIVTSLSSSITTLDLSGNPNITEKDLINMLSKLRLQSLCLFNNPRINFRASLRLIARFNLIDLRHLMLYQRAFIRQGMLDRH
jgi:hypothetical protein